MIVETLMLVKAYSPYDEVDKAWRLKNPIPITARGRNCNDHPYGIAADLKAYPKGTTIIVPEYNNNTPALVDDTGGDIRRAKVKWIEVRFKTEAEARKWGNKSLLVKIIYP